MNALDVLILIVAILFGLNGFFRGLVHQVFFAAAVFAGIAGGMHLSPYAGKIFSVFTQNQDLLRLLGFALSFVLIAVTVGLLGRLVHRGFRLLALGWLDHILGAVFGIGTALLLTAFGVYILQALLPRDSKFVSGSTFAPHAQKVAKRMLALIPEHLVRRFEEKLREIRARRAPPGARAGEAPPQGSSFTVISPSAPPPRAMSELRTGLVDAKKVAGDIRVELRYATTDNFLKRRLYRSDRCLLQRAVARRLARAQRSLRKQGLGLKLWDCYRPLSVQRQMWAAAPKPGYVADPRVGSNHNRGAAVDVTLVDRQGRELAMPTDFDDFTPRAHQGSDASAAARKNRETLRKAMLAAGFLPLATEWWHYDAPDAGQYPLLDVPAEYVP